MHISTMLVFWSLFSLVRNSVVLAVYLLFSVACFFTVHEHSVEDISSFSFSFGSIFVLLACVCWGLENNCTRMISNKDPLQIVVIKGFGSGIGSFVIALVLGEHFSNWGYIVCALLLGFVAYGLSIFFYIYAQRYLGAAKTSAYYALAPFIGAALSLLIFREIPTISFVAALLIMIAGTYLASTDTNK